MGSEWRAAMPRMDPPKVPKDGFGPRGLPDCYYTSRTLNSTFRYVRFVKRLRQMEEEIKRGEDNRHKERVDKQNLDFFIRCDRKSLINKVADRVKICVESYEMDLAAKKKRLTDLLSIEEREHITLFAAQTQAGAEAAWQAKQQRLQFLLAKRQKEREDKFKDTPLSKCAHIFPCVFKLRAKEAEEIQLYQMQEKEKRKMAELERENMWHEVAMKESEALAARMEMDTIERHRRDIECKKYTDLQLEMRKREREKERELLKQEVLQMKAKWHEDDLKEAEAERKRQIHRHEMAHERKAMIKERQETVAQQEAAAALISGTWDSLAGQGLAAIKAKEDLRRQKERELDICNRKMCEMKQRMSEVRVNNEPLIAAEGQRRQDAAAFKRCQYRKWTQNMQKQIVATLKEQMKEKEDEVEEQARKAQELEYRRQVDAQLEQLVKQRQLTDAQAKKLYQSDLLQQMDYNKSLKERAKEEAKLEAEKCKLAAEEYQREIAKMLSRPFFSDDVHPFMKQMSSGLKMRQTCPCSKPDYCLDSLDRPALLY